MVITFSFRASKGSKDGPDPLTEFQFVHLRQREGVNCKPSNPVIGNIGNPANQVKFSQVHEPRQLKVASESRCKRYRLPEPTDSFASRESLSWMCSSPLDKHKAMMISYWVHGVYWNAGNCSTVELWNRHMCRYPASKKKQKQSEKVGGGRYSSSDAGCLVTPRFLLPNLRRVGQRGVQPQPRCLLVGKPNKNHHIHLGRLTWNLQITHLEGKMIFQTSMIMFHVNLQGCTSRMFLETKRDPSSAHIMFIKLDLRTNPSIIPTLPTWRSASLGKGTFESPSSTRWKSSETSRKRKSIPWLTAAVTCPERGKKW